MKNLNKSLLFLSIVIYLISLTQIAFKTHDIGKIVIYKSYEVLLMGGIGFLGGGVFESIIWSANIWFLLGLIFTKNKKRKEAFFFTTIATIISISFMFWKEVLAAESGRTAEIFSLNIGYFLWITSIIVLFIDSVINKFKNT